MPLGNKKRIFYEIVPGRHMFASMKDIVVPLEKENMSFFTSARGTYFLLLEAQI